jgi:hypothetical protein
MPICKNCTTKFPNWIYIDNKNRNLQSRKYCLECSPFGKHNTKQLTAKLKSDKKCICTDCNKEYLHSKKRGNSLIRCGPCYVKKYRLNKKIKAINLLGGKCCKCGYNRCLKALQFHHIDPKQKEFHISSNNKSIAWNIIEKELKKCILVCANCHAEIHDKFREV